MSFTTWELKVLRAPGAPERVASWEKSSASRPARPPASPRPHPQHVIASSDAMPTDFVGRGASCSYSHAHKLGLRMQVGRGSVTGK